MKDSDSDDNVDDTSVPGISSGEIVVDILSTSNVDSSNRRDIVDNLLIDKVEISSITDDIVEINVDNMEEILSTDNINVDVIETSNTEDVVDTINVYVVDTINVDVIETSKTEDVVNTINVDVVDSPNREDEEEIINVDVVDTISEDPDINIYVDELLETSTVESGEIPSVEQQPEANRLEVVHEAEGLEEVDDDHSVSSDDEDEIHRNAVYLDLYDEDEGIEIVQDSDDENHESSATTEEYSSDDEDEGNTNNIKKTTFDISLPNSHSYMGEDMEELHGRTIHTEGDYVIMPLFFQPGVVLVPGQTLPLNLFHPQPISMMKKVIAADKTFGLMMSKGNQSSDERNSFASVGVTCEIHSVREDSVYGVDQMSLKGEGRQRFRIISKQFQMDGVIMGKILILPDAAIPPYPKMSLIYSQHRQNGISSQVMANNFYVNNNKWKLGEARYLMGFNAKDKTVLCKSTAAIPGWVYRLYNPYFLMDCLMNEIGSWNSNLRVDNIPINPTDFSHWITANLPLTNEMKIELLEIDSAVLRLRRQIELMNKCTTTLACNRCKAVITDKAELFCLSLKGPMAAYVNPGGHVHETVTFYKAKNLLLRGKSSTEYSWFPGYAWTIAECKSCREHMGWKFTAAKKGLQPTKFWGLTRAGLKPVFKDIEGDGGGGGGGVDMESDHDDGSGNYSMFNAIMYESNI